MTSHALASTLFAISVAQSLVSAVLFVIFGQVTVRRLRQHPETRDRLGIEFITGWDIVNVARELSVPRRYARWAGRRALAAMHADIDALYRHTTRLERAVGRAQFWTMILSTLCLLAAGWMGGS